MLQSERANGFKSGSDVLKNETLLIIKKITKVAGTYIAFRHKSLHKKVSFFQGLKLTKVCFQLQFPEFQEENQRMDQKIMGMLKLNIK